MKRTILNFFKFNNLAYFSSISILAICSLYLYFFKDTIPYFFLILLYIIILIKTFRDYDLKMNFDTIIILLCVIIIFVFILYPGTAFAEEPDINVDALKKQLAFEKLYFQHKYNTLQAKASHLKKFFYSFTTGVEYHIQYNRYIPKMDETPEEAKDDTKMLAANQHLVELQKELKKEANVLSDKIKNIDKIDKEIHSLTKANYSNKEYKDLLESFSKYRTDTWYLTENENPGRFETRYYSDLNVTYKRGRDDDE